MPTTFIAAQCFQCSTMQVKQQKKRNNKWTCVVCGEKQSLRKVFAQGSMAKEVRKFVQNFNMSRQFEEEVLLDSPRNKEKNEYQKRRTDWTEYVDDDDDDQDEYCGKMKVAQGDSELEPVIVTEMPKALFKRPKLPAYSASGLKYPNISNEGANSEGSVSKWKGFMGQGDSNEVPPAQLYQSRAAKGAVSKWSCFITEDDEDELQIRGRRDSRDQISQRDTTDGFELMNDQKVEDDIHPDFL